MALSKHLVLFRFVLKQLGYADFDALREEHHDRRTGYDTTGRSYYVQGLVGKSGSTIDERQLLSYDEHIREYEKKLRDHRAEPYLSFKYYQYFSLLFTEYFFDRLNGNAKTLLKDLNEYKSSTRDYSSIEDYQEHDLKKLAFWMATGSGKTLIMHCNYWQVQRYFKDWENIILITPNEGLSQQHYEELVKSRIPAKRYTGSEESLKCKEGEVLIIEITKLVKEKEGDGVSVDVDYFSESRNLILIDEGHKGQKSEEQTWKKLREHLARGKGSFIVEYSATFGQIITGTKTALLQEYGRSIIFDYSYRHFYADGYGKDFVVFNIDAKQNYSEVQTRLLLTASLMGFYEQLVLFEQHKEELRQYKIEKPLWVFVGSKVVGNGSSLTVADKESISDVTRIIKFFNQVLGSPAALQQDMDTILNERSELFNADGHDIFKGRFAYLQANRPVADAVLEKVFLGAGTLEAAEIKQADGEIGLKTKLGDNTFGVINIGDVAKYSKKLKEDTAGELEVTDDHFSKSLFRNISESSSTINILIGSKKFIEGWNSWRVSSMGLMNMGSGEGPQIIQLFGRGVRLKGKEFSLKREDENAPYHIKALQTISIFGLNASYMNSFLSNIEKEVPEYVEYPIEINYNQTSEWENKVVTFRTDVKHDFKDHLVWLERKQTIAERINIDLRTKISVAAGGFNSAWAENTETYNTALLQKYGGFVDYAALTVEAERYKMLRGYSNLIITSAAIQNIITQHGYSIFYSNEDFGIEQAVNGRIQEVAEYVVKDYINKFYSDQEKDHLTKNLTFGMLNRAEYPDVFPAENRIIIKAPKERRDEMDALVADIEKFHTEKVEEIPTIHFNSHLYSPLAVWKKGDKFQDIKTVPVKLNEGETRFVGHLKDYLASATEQLKGKDVYLLRNLSRNKGVGFFIESSSFYPDFILWVIDGNKQNIFFLDPKGIKMSMGNFTDDKIIFCSKLIGEISSSVQAKVKKESKELEVVLDAYILSVSKYADIKKQWGDEGASKKDFAANHVLFIEEDKEYLRTIFSKCS